jgi:hypothetical protein
MAIADDIAAVRADPTKTEKDVNKIKCASMFDAMLSVKGQTFRYNQKDWTLWDLWLEDDGALLCFTFKCVGTGANAGVTYMRPQTVHKCPNPPPLAADRSDNRIQAAKEILDGLVP